MAADALELVNVPTPAQVPGCHRVPVTMPREATDASSTFHHTNVSQGVPLRHLRAFMRAEDENTILRLHTVDVPIQNRPQHVTDRNVSGFFTLTVLDKNKVRIEVDVPLF